MARPNNPGPCRAAEVQQAKTHCPKGHPYDQSNTYRRGNSRECRTCRRLAVQRYEQRTQRLAVAF
jgi:hypothetical protein